ncbi:MAG: hypothetical protein QM756_16090 [Polyangiaceae bacterium]
MRTLPQQTLDPDVLMILADAKPQAGHRRRLQVDLARQVRRRLERRQLGKREPAPADLDLLSIAQDGRRSVALQQPLGAACEDAHLGRVFVRQQ